MGVDDAEGGRLLLQVKQDAHQHDVLDDVGKAAGVKGVTVVHAAWVTTSALVIASEATSFAERSAFAL